MKKKRVALIRPGIHQTDIDFAEALHAEGFDVHLLIPAYVNREWCRSKKIKIITYKTLNRRFSYYFPIALNVYQILKELDPDVVQTGEDFQASSWHAAAYCRRFKKHMVLISEKYTYPNFLNRFIFWIIDSLNLSKNVWETSRYIIAHGSESKKFLIKRGCKKGIVILPMCVNLDKFRFKKRRVRMKPLMLLSVARLIPHKGLDILIDSIEHLDDIHLTIIGAGPLKKQIKDMIREKRLSGRITMIDHVKHDELHRYFNDSDVYVCSSRREVDSNSVHEAMACGMPIITSDAGSTKDHVKPGINGYVFENQNSMELRGAIEKFMTLPGLGRSMGIESRKIAVKKFDYPKTIKNYGSYLLGKKG